MSSSNPKETTKNELHTKLKQKRQLMQRVRTNTCSMDTLQHISDMDPKLQMQALQQVKLKTTKSSASQDTKDADKTNAKPKATTKKPRARKPAQSRRSTTTPTEPVDVTQSTADTNQSISEAKKQILMTALEKEVDRVAGDEDLSGLTGLGPEFKTHAKNGLSMLKQMMKNPAFMEKISAQLSKWSQPGGTPNPESIAAFIQELIALIKAGVESSDKKTSQQPQFNHGPTTTTKIFSENGKDSNN